MSFSKLFMMASFVVALPVFAGTVSCISDERPVDGGLVKFDLTIAADGSAVAEFYEESASPVVSHSEKTEIRALSCKVDNHPFTNISCEGPIEVSLSDMELAPPPGGNFSHLFHVSTSFKDKHFTFGRQVSAPLKSECEFHL